MDTKTILALIAALIANGPALGADVAKLIASLTETINGNPNATAADILAKAQTDLADAAAVDKAVELGTV